MPDSKFETRGTCEPACPYCGHRHRDAWDWGDYDTHECAGCGKVFAVERIVDVTYNTGPAIQCVHCQQWMSVKANGALPYHYNYRKAAECPGSKKPPAEGSAP